MISSGTSFIAMVKATHLWYLHDPAVALWLHHS